MSKSVLATIGSRAADGLPGRSAAAGTKPDTDQGPEWPPEGPEPLKCPESAILPLSSRNKITRKTQILYVIDQLCIAGGAERALLQMINGLPRDRFQSRVVTFNRASTFGLSDSISCPVHVFPLRRTYDMNALRVALRLRELMRREQIDIVHTFHETSDLWAGLIVKATGSAALVSSRRDMGILRSTKHEIGYKYFAKHFDRVLCVSERVREQCLDRERLSPKTTLTLHNGIDLSLADQRPRDGRVRAALAISREAPLILTVGNIRRIKGLDLLIHAASIVCQRRPEVVFLVAGEAEEIEYFESIQGTVRSLGLAQNIRFLGRREDIYSILAAGDIFCLPSQSEGFSNALIEAMACSLPSVVTDVGGNSEAIKDGSNGFVVPSDDPEQFATRLLELIDQPKRAASMGVAARRTVEICFTLNGMLSKLVHTYDELTSPSRI